MVFVDYFRLSPGENRVLANWEKAHPVPKKPEQEEGIRASLNWTDAGWGRKVRTENGVYLNRNSLLRFLERHGDKVSWFERWFFSTGKSLKKRAEEAIRKEDPDFGGRIRAGAALDPSTSRRSQETARQSSIIQPAPTVASPPTVAPEVPAPASVAAPQPAPAIPVVVSEPEPRPAPVPEPPAPAPVGVISPPTMPAPVAAPAVVAEPIPAPEPVRAPVPEPAAPAPAPMAAPLPTPEPAAPAPVAVPDADPQANFMNVYQHSGIAAAIELIKQDDDMVLTPLLDRLVAAVAEKKPIDAMKLYASLPAELQVDLVAPTLTPEQVAALSPLDRTWHTAHMVPVGDLVARVQDQGAKAWDMLQTLIDWNPGRAIEFYVAVGADKWDRYEDEINREAVTPQFMIFPQLSLEVIRGLTPAQRRDYYLEIMGERLVAPDAHMKETLSPALLPQITRPNREMSDREAVAEIQKLNEIVDDVFRHHPNELREAIGASSELATHHELKKTMEDFAATIRLQLRNKLENTPGIPLGQGSSFGQMARATTSEDFNRHFEAVMTTVLEKAPRQDNLDMLLLYKDAFLMQFPPNLKNMEALRMLQQSLQEYQRSPGNTPIVLPEDYQAIVNRYLTSGANIYPQTVKNGLRNILVNAGGGVAFGADAQMVGNPMALGNLRGMLLAVITKLRDPNVPPKNKAKALITLAEGGQHCAGGVVTAAFDAFDHTAMTNTSTRAGVARILERRRLDIMDHMSLQDRSGDPIHRKIKIVKALGDWAGLRFKDALCYRDPFAQFGGAEIDIPFEETRFRRNYTPRVMAQALLDVHESDPAVKGYFTDDRWEAVKSTVETEIEKHEGQAFMMELLESQGLVQIANPIPVRQEVEGLLKRIQTVPNSVDIDKLTSIFKDKAKAQALGERYLKKVARRLAFLFNDHAWNEKALQISPEKRTECFELLPTPYELPDEFRQRSSGYIGDALEQMADMLRAEGKKPDEITQLIRGYASDAMAAYKQIAGPSVQGKKLYLVRKATTKKDQYDGAMFVVDVEGQPAGALFQRRAQDNRWPRIGGAAFDTLQQASAIDNAVPLPALPVSVIEEYLRAKIRFRGGVTPQQVLAKAFQRHMAAAAAPAVAPVVVPPAPAPVAVPRPVPAPAAPAPAVAVPVTAISLPKWDPRPVEDRIIEIVADLRKAATAEERTKVAARLIRILGNKYEMTTLQPEQKASLRRLLLKLGNEYHSNALWNCVSLLPSPYAVPDRVKNSGGHHEQALMQGIQDAALDNLEPSQIMTLADEYAKDVIECYRLSLPPEERNATLYMIRKSSLLVDEKDEAFFTVYMGTGFSSWKKRLCYNVKDHVWGEVGNSNWQRKTDAQLTEVLGAQSKAVPVLSAEDIAEYFRIRNTVGRQAAVEHARSRYGNWRDNPPAAPVPIPEAPAAAAPPRELHAQSDAQLKAAQLAKVRKELFPHLQRTDEVGIRANSQLAHAILEWGTPDKYPEAVAMLQKAAEAGDVKAQLKLHDCYDKGLGVAKDANLATAYLQQAAELGSKRALSAFGEPAGAEYRDIFALPPE